MSKLLLVLSVFALCILVSSCGYMGGSGQGNIPENMPHDTDNMMGGNNGYSGNQPGEGTTDHEHEEEVAPPPSDLAFDEERAKNTFLQNCSRCHGVDLQGGGPYPSLQQVGLTHTKDDILNVIKTGPGMMPANLISGQEAENLAKWLWTKR